MPDAIYPVILTRAPGVKAWTTVGTGTIKGMYAAPVSFSAGRQDYLYVVSGDEWYHVDSDGTAVLIGNIGTPGIIDMASNETDVVLTNDPKGYYWDGTTFGEITDDDFITRGAAEVEYLDKYFIFREPDSNRFFLADIGSATEYDSLQFTRVDDNPDELTGLQADRGILFCAGEKSIEVFLNTGAAGVPFERVVNGTIEVGYIPNTFARAFNRVLFVADDFTVRMFEGFQPMRASTHAIEQHLASETVISAMAYAQEGHFFYAVTTDAGTYIYDIVTTEWHERESYQVTNWTPQYTQPFAGKILVGDSNSNKIGELDFDTYDDWGSTQRMEWTYQPIYADGNWAFHDRFEIVLETGLGLTTGQGSDPKIMLEKSDDGGVTWTSLPDKSIGALGKRLTRAVWHNLGRSKQRVYRAAVSDPVAITVRDTITEVRGGRL